MKQAQENSVKHLEGLYSIVVGIGLSIAIYNLVNTTGGNVSLKIELLPFFGAFLVTLIPFYHGALRHLDITYIEQGGKHVHRFALLVDFLALFIESCLLLALAFLIVKPSSFSWGLVVLLGFDTLWAIIAHLGFSQDSPKAKLKPELRWGVINFITTIILISYLVFLLPEKSTGDLRLLIGVPCISLLRSIIDYASCWDTYYPSSKL